MKMCGLLCVLPKDSSCTLPGGKNIPFIALKTSFKIDWLCVARLTERFTEDRCTVITVCQKIQICNQMACFPIFLGQRQESQEKLPGFFPWRNKFVSYTRTYKANGWMAEMRVLSSAWNPCQFLWKLHGHSIWERVPSPRPEDMKTWFLSILLSSTFIDKSWKWQHC